MLDYTSDQHTPFESSEVSNPLNEIRALEGRLDRGWQVISTKEKDGESTDALFNHFMQLLRQYEALCDDYLVT